MNKRDIELAKQAGMTHDKYGMFFAKDYHEDGVDLEKFADLIRTEEREAFVAFIQNYPHWLGDNAKREIISAIRARGNV